MPPVPQLVVVVVVSFLDCCCD